MGILNVTSDSFYADSRKVSEQDILARVGQLVDEGVDIIDVGGCSTRPGIELVSEEVELNRIRLALTVIRRQWPSTPVSVDTFRSKVAKVAVNELGADMINDISGGSLDKDLFKTVASLQVPYVLTHIQGTPTTMQVEPHYENLVKEVMEYFSEKTARLRDAGLNDILLDPGFGFGKTQEQNYELLRRLSDFQLFDLPLLVGVSRKSMIYKLLNLTPEASLNGTTALNTLALMQGAHILRVHDVAEARQCVTLVNAFQTAGLC
jgi:dihydropteroate synthase